MQFVPSTSANLRRAPRAYGVPMSETPVFALSAMFFLGVGALTVMMKVDEWRKKRVEVVK